ncbi:MAG: hypothetical protein HN368_00205, partial [Spirochaetales bacterium]|nr:hypothetical protein [Spirochaetales bacterium]
IEFRLATGRSIYASLSSYTIAPNSVEIQFGNRLTLGISTGGFQKQIEAITDLEMAAELVLPYTTAGTVQVSEHGIPLLSLTSTGRNGGGSSAVALPPGSTIDLVNSAFILRSNDGIYDNFYVTRFESADTPHTAYWFESQYDFPLALDYYEAIAGFEDSAFQDWTTGRYNRATGTWTMPDGSQSFSEVLLSAVLSEASSRGVLSNTLNSLRNATTLHQDKTTWVTAPHLGDIVNRGRDIEIGDQNLIERINSLITQENSDVFAIPDLLKFVADRAPARMFQNLADLTSRINLDNLSLNTTVSMLTAYSESTNLNDPLAEAFSRFRGLIESRLLSSLVLTDRGLFLGSGPELVDIAASISGGLIIARIGEDEGNTLYENIGRELVVSALTFTDDSPYLPAIAKTDENTIANSSGAILPEEIYASLTGSDFYPHQVSLSESAGPGIWAWTVSNEFDVRKTPNGLVISFEYPVKSTHHFILKGIAPFSGISFFGIQWKSDPRFQFYNSGWLYSEADEALYVKITHSEVREELVIRY